MDHSKITVRYAKALFELAKERSLLEVVKKDVELIFQLCNESIEFKSFLESPIIKTSQKIKLLNSLFSENIHEQSMNFIRLVTENKRESHLQGICRNILTLYRNEQGIKTAVLTSAVTLDRTLTTQIAQQLEKELKAKVELSGKVNPELIGGFILRVDDRQLDASVATQLQKIKQRLLKTEIN